MLCVRRRSWSPRWELDPEQEAARLLRQIAAEYVARGDAERAVAALQQAVTLDPSLNFVPEEWVARALLDRAEYELGNDDEVLAALTEAVELAPRFREDAAEVLFEFVADAVFEVRIFYDDAVAAIEQVVEWNSDLTADGAGLLVTIGQGYVDRGDYARGLALLRQAVEWESSRAGAASGGGENSGSASGRRRPHGRSGGRPGATARSRPV